MFLGLSQFGPAPVSWVGPVGPCWVQNDFGPSVVDNESSVRWEAMNDLRRLLLMQLLII